MFILLIDNRRRNIDAFAISSFIVRRRVEAKLYQRPDIIRRVHAMNANIFAKRAPPATN